MAVDAKSSSWIVQLAFAAAAGFAVYAFVNMAKNAEMRRACDPLVELRPRYLGHDRTAPDFDLSDGHGGSLKLSSLRGKVVILHFWSKTCGPCLEELPLIAEFAEKIKDRKDVALVAVTIDDGPAAIKDVLAGVFGDKGPSFPILFDPENKVVRGMYGTKLFPETWLIDPNGTIRARFDGIPFAGERCDPMWRTAILLSAIDALRGPAECDLTFNAKVDPPEKLIARCPR
jgi:thiol-disulfide isomerase/thioredoxin